MSSAIDDSKALFGLNWDLAKFLVFQDRVPHTFGVHCTFKGVCSPSRCTGCARERLRAVANRQGITPVQVSRFAGPARPLVGVHFLQSVHWIYRLDEQEEMTAVTTT